MSILRAYFSPIKPTRRTPRPNTPFGVGIEEGYQIIQASSVHGHPTRTAVISEVPNPAGDSYRYAVRMFDEGREIEANGFDVLADAQAYLRHITLPLPYLKEPVRRPLPPEPEILDDFPTRKPKQSLEDEIWWGSQQLARSATRG